MNLDLIPVIDAHCHPFTEEHQQINEQQLRDIMLFKLEGGAPPQALDTMTAHLFLREVSELLDCSATPKAVLDARNQQTSINYPEYVDRVLRAANITALLPDTGYPYWKKVTIQDCAKVVKQQKLYEVFRVESIFSSRNGIYMSDPDLKFDEYIEQYRDACTNAIKKAGCKAMKTVIAYRTGLAIQSVSYVDAKSAYGNNTDIDLKSQKTVRDYLFKYTAQLAAELNVPFLMHTGFTALTKPWDYGNPTNLSPIVTDPDLKDTIFILLHGGYPWNSAAGFMAAHHPNIYLDLSEFNPATSIGVEHNFREVLQFAPLSKIMFGSDGLGIPELFWYAAKLAKRAMGKILNDFVHEGLMTTEKAEDYASQFFHGTVKKVFQLAD